MTKSRSLRTGWKRTQSYTDPSHAREIRCHSVPSRLTEAQINAMRNTHHPTFYAATNRPQKAPISAISSEESWTYDYESDLYSDAEEEEERSLTHRWYLRLPIHGTLARRRALARGHDPSQIQRQQRSQLIHEIESRSGALRDIDTTFHAVDFAAGMHDQTRFAINRGGEAVSPASLPRVEQMSLREYERVIGESGKWSEVLDVGMGREVVEWGSVDDLLVDYSFFPIVSAPVEEGWFSEDPFKGRPGSAAGCEGETRGDRYYRL